LPNSAKKVQEHFPDEARAEVIPEWGFQPTDKGISAIVDSGKHTASTAAAKSLQSCPTLCDPMDSSPPGSPPLGFSRQEHWSGLPFPSPMHESEVAQSCLTLSDPMDCSPPGFSVHGIFQARVLEWGAIAFSKYREA